METPTSTLGHGEIWKRGTLFVHLLIVTYGCLLLLLLTLLLLLYEAHYHNLYKIHYSSIMITIVTTRHFGLILEKALHDHLEGSEKQVGIAIDLDLIQSERGQSQ